MATELFKIDISEWGLDNVYTFYDDGSIHRFFDKSQYSSNNDMTYTWEQLKGRSDWQKIKAKCTDEQLSILKALFGDIGD